MDYIEKYKQLFEMIKHHKYDEFIKLINDIDTSDNIFDINIRDEQNNYFLTYAVTLNEIKIVRLLIDKGARVDIVDKYDKSILLIPITYSYYDMLIILLDANIKNIGISIIDIKDRNYRIPLHYAIEIQNITAIKILLEYGSNPNIVDKDGYNSLHLAVKSRSLEICNIIIKYIANINSRYNTGESSLHISCNLQLVEITNLLISKGIDVNVTDYSHEITPLHYSVLLNNKELIEILLKHNANPNGQDVYGNTPLHYCIIENNFEIFLLLLQYETTKNIINLNIWNIDGELPLHLVLKNSMENVTNYIDILINKSNLSIQDNDGNTCLHYIIKLDLWKLYKTNLIKKRLDIFSINTQKLMPIDMINKNDYDEFINLIIDSYLDRLITAKELWYEEWENICSKNFDEISEKDKKIIEKEKNNYSDNITKNSFEPICKNIIKDKLIKLINTIHEGHEIKCYEKTFPIRRSTLCIDITEGSKLDYCTFTGNTLDILIGLLFLLMKHKDACATLTKQFSQNKELCGFYKSIGILMNTKCEFLNFEIVWVHQKLYLMDGFYDQFKNCLLKTKQFIIIPIGIEMREGNHAGYLIYDNIKKEIERFEPHGSTTPPGLYYNPNLLDEILEARFKTIDVNIKYIRPIDYLPKIGFQLLDINENKKKQIGDPEGFCALWSIWYVDMRLTYKDIDRKELVEMLLRTIKSKNISFKNMIRNYGKYIIDIRDNILKEAEMNINDWLNDQYTDIQINSVMTKLNEQVEKIMI